MAKLISLFFVGICFIGCIGSNRKAEGTAVIPSTDSMTCAKLEGTRLDSTVIVISQTGDSLKLVDLPQKEKFLFLRYSNYGCKDCIDYVVTELKKHNLNSQVCFLIAEVPVRDLHVIQRLEKLHGTYQLDSFVIDFDYGLTPYMFQIDQKGEICHLHIPREEDSKAFELYLRNFQECGN